MTCRFIFIAKSIVYTFCISYLLIVSCTPSHADTDSTAKRSYAEPSQTNVSVAIAREGSFSRELISNGKLAAVQRAVVPFAVQEQVADVAVSEGQAVAKGQLQASVEVFRYALQFRCHMQLREHKNAQNAPLSRMCLNYSQTPYVCERS